MNTSNLEKSLSIVDSSTSECQESTDSVNSYFYSGNNKKGNEIFQMYLKDISRKKRLTPEEELELGRLIEKGGPEAQKARAKLVQANLRLVISIAKRWATQLCPTGNQSRTVGIGMSAPGQIIGTKRRD